MGQSAVTLLYYCISQSIYIIASPRVTQNPELTEVSLHPSVAHGSKLKNWISEQRGLRLAGFQFPFSGEKQGDSSPHFHATTNISVTLKAQRSFNSCPPARVSHWDQLS